MDAFLKTLQTLPEVAELVSRVENGGCPAVLTGTQPVQRACVGAAVAAGADGLIIEVHNDPAHAKCDGQQSLTPKKFDDLMGKVGALVNMMGKTLV